MRVMLGGAAIDLVDLDEARSRMLGVLEAQEPTPALFVTFADLAHVHHFGLDSGREGRLRDDGDASWLVLPDAAALTWAAQRLDGVHLETLARSEFITEALRTGQRLRARVGFLGGDEEQRTGMPALVATHYPGIELVGHWTPPRSTIDDQVASDELAEEIADAGLDLLFVGLGKPRQEDWLRRHGHGTAARVVIAHGDADFLSGSGPVAAGHLARSTSRWTTRLAREPGRTLRQHLVHEPAALLRLIGQPGTGPSSVSHGSPTPPVMATPRLWRRRIGRILVLADGTTIALSSALAYGLREALGQTGVVRAFANEVPVALGVIPLWLLIFHYAGAYRPEVLNTGGDAFRRFVAGAAGGLFALGFVSFLFNLALSRLYVFLLFSLVLAIGGLARIALRRYLRSRRARGRLRQNVLVVGADTDAIAAATALSADEMSGYTPVGFLADDVPVGREPIPGVPVVGPPESVIDVAYDRRAGLVILSPTGVGPGTLQDLTVALEGTPVDLAVAPSLFQVMARRVTVESVANVPILHVDQVRLERGKAALKRSVDVVIALTLMTVTLPIVLLAMVAIRLDSPGPVLFLQRRAGREGRPINVLKLRTMVQGAEDRRAELVEMNEAEGHFFKIRQDPRVTRVGRLLRRFSIDELPQLHNVLRGDMSMVGPRPPTPDEVAKYEPWQMRRLRVRPGITGVWQTSGRAEIGFDEAVKLDLFYIENWSLGYDLFLMGKTVVAVLSGRGAY